MESAKPTASCRKLSYFDRSVTRGASSQITFTLSAATASRKLSSLRLGVAENGLPATLGNWVTRFTDHLVFFEKPEHKLSSPTALKRGCMVEGSVDCETWLGIISPHGVAWTV